MSFLDQFLKDLSSKVSSTITQEAKSKLNQAVNTAANSAASAIQKKVFTKTKSFTFENIPTSLDEFKALPEANDLTDPFATTALTIVAFAAYAKNKEAGTEMFNVLKGPSPLTQLDIQRTDGALKEKKEYLPLSYFEGATLDNNYTPAKPYKVTVYETQSSDATLSEGYKRLYVKTSGADTERTILLRLKPSTKQWFLSEYATILSGIREPKTVDPWA